MIGYVQKYDMQKGFGFILDYEQTDAANPTHFVHANPAYFFHIKEFVRAGAEGVDKKPKVGESVTFELHRQKNGKSLEAINVRPL